MTDSDRAELTRLAETWDDAVEHYKSPDPATIRAILAILRRAGALDAPTAVQVGRWRYHASGFAVDVGDLIWGVERTPALSD